MAPWPFTQQTKEDLIEVQIGDGNITVDLPSHISREQEENDTTVVFIPNFRGASRFTVQYLHHNLDASIHGLGVERVEAISKEKGIKLHHVDDKYYFTFIEQSEEEVDKEDIHFWVVGHDNAIIIASCCIVCENKKTQEARDLLNITKAAIDSIRYSKIISFEAKDQGPIKTRPLTPRELSELDRWRQAVYDLAKASPQHYLFLGTEADLATMQTLFNGNLVDKKDKYALAGFGITLGDILRKKLDLEWVTIIDGSETTPALQHHENGPILFVRDMIVKRVDQGEEIDIFYLYNNLVEMVRQMMASGDYEKPKIK